MLVLCKEPDRLEKGKSDSSWGRALSEEAQTFEPFFSRRAVLQIVTLDARLRLGGAGHKTLDHLNERLLSTLKVVYQLNTSRLQLLNLLDVQSSLERWTHVALARQGHMMAPDLRKLEQFKIEVRRAVAMGGEAWRLAGSAFTRLTRFLPVHLEDEEPRFKPIAAADMKRLARICAAAAPGQLPVPFSEEVARYEKAAADVAMTTAKVAGTGKVLRDAEDGFRVGLRDACELASALIEHSQQKRELMQKTMRACVASHTLYALAKLLPEQLGLS